MKKFSLFLLVLTLCGCAPKSSGGTALARFDGTAVTDRDFVRRIESAPAEVRSFASRRRKEFLNDLVAEHYLAKEAKKRGYEKDAEVNAVLEAARRRILISRLVEKEIDDKIVLGPEEAQHYYLAHKEEFMTALALRASHILVKTEQEAALIKQALDQGADFEEMARKNSLDATAIRGGDLGFFQRGRFVPEFEDAVFQMKKNDIRGPVRSQFGYHVIKLTDRAEPVLRDLKDVKTFVEQRLISEKRVKAFKALVEKLKGNAKIEIDEKKLEALDLKI